MKSILILVFLFCSHISIGQEITTQIQNYYVHNDANQLDTVGCLVYKIVNRSPSSIVIMFTEDTISDMPIERLIKRKLFRKYGDFSLSCWALDNISNMSKHILIPDMFVKVINPNDSFTLTITSINVDMKMIDSILKQHILICNDYQIGKVVRDLLSVLKECDTVYPYTSLTINWSQINRFITSK